MCQTQEKMGLGVEFLFAGRAIFTIQNPEGKHYTYRVSRAKDGDTFFISLLTGPDNMRDYTYMGILSRRGEFPRVVLTAASKYRPESEPVRVADFVCRVLAGGRDLPAGYFLGHCGRCGRCGRPLTNPRSLQIGIGPECEGKLG